LNFFFVDSKPDEQGHRKGIEELKGKDVIIANATGCMEIVSSPLPYTSWRVPWIHTLFENTAAVASGIESAVKILERKGRIAGKQITRSHTDEDQKECQRKSC
jgi:pyruvate/2-oxoacid:ferredoxin oxidoreductase beta subunit